MSITSDRMAEVIECLLSKDKIKSQKGTALLQKYQHDPSAQMALKQCFKAWRVAFSGEDNIPLLSPSIDDAMPPEQFGRYFMREIYPQLYALCQFAQIVENKGSPAQQATKLCVMFNKEETALQYLLRFVQSAQLSDSPMHDACAFVLPDFQAPGFLDHHTGCKFELFQEKAKKVETMLNKDFKDLLPFAFELQQRVVKAIEASEGLIPDKEAITTLTKEIQVLQKRHDELERKKARLSDKEHEEYDRLPIQLSEKFRQLATLCAGKRLKDLSLLELRAFYEQKVEADPVYKQFIEEGIPRRYYEEFKKLDRSSASLHLPEMLIDGKAINHPGYYLMKVPVATDEQQAARAACFGKLTDCCQSLSGEAGHECVKHGLTSPYGGFYVLCQGDARAPTIADPVIAQTWAWRSQTNAIVFDSIETENKSRENKQRVIDFFQELAKQMVFNHYTNKVSCGASSGISSEIGVTGVGIEKEQFKDYQGYSDSEEQRAIYDAQKPYYFYQVHEEYRTQTRKMIKAAADHYQALGKNPWFIQMLSWMLLESKEDIRREIQGIFVSQEQRASLNRIIEALQEYQMNYALEGIIAELDYVDVIDEYGKTPLMEAAEQGDVERCLQLIKKGANVNAKDNQGETALHRAVGLNHHAVGMMLMEHGADVNAKSQFNRSPLLWAVQRGFRELSATLIKKGADINVKNQDEKTPLMIAAEQNDPDLCVMLIRAGATWNETLFSQLQGMKQPEIVEAIAARLAPTKLTDAIEKRNKGLIFGGIEAKESEFKEIQQNEQAVIPPNTPDDNEVERVNKPRL